MNIKEIQELIKFVSKSGVTEVSIEQENFKITIKTGVSAGGAFQGGGSAYSQSPQAIQGAPGQYPGQGQYPLVPGQFPLGSGQFLQGQASQGQFPLAPGQQDTLQPGHQVGSPKAGHDTDTAEKQAAVDQGRLLTIKSPMIGTFYRTPGPEKPAFVNIGDEITVGKTVCVIEAMKLFNDIESEISGRIVKALVENASPVEYDQPLFLVEPL